MGIGLAAGLEGKPGSIAIFFVAVLIATLIGGIVPGLVAAVLSYLPLSYYFLEPVHSFAPSGSSIVAVAAFFVGSGLVALLVERERRARAAVVSTVEEQRRLARALAASEERLVRALEETETGSWEWDVRSNRVWWSENLGPLHGLGRGKQPESYDDYLALIHPDDRSRVEEAVNAAMADGSGYEIELRTSPTSGEARWIWAQASVITDPAGNPLRIVGITRDITERKQRENRAQLLASVTEALSSSLDLEVALGEVARLAVPDLADWCSIDLSDERGGAVTAAVARVDRGGRASDVAEIVAGPNLSRLLRTGSSLLYPDLAQELGETVVGEEELAPLRRLGARSAMLVPLKAHGATLGAMTFVILAQTDRYDTSDVAFAEEFARRVALAIDNARAHQVEQKARELAEAAALRMERLQRLAALLSAAVTPVEVAEILVHEGAASMGAMAGWVSALTEEGDELEYLASFGYEMSFVEENRLIPVGGSHIAAEVARTAEPCWLEMTSDATRPELRSAHRATGAEALAMVPLVAGEERLGFMALRFPGARVFEVGERELLLTFARQCAQSLQRSRLFESEQRARHLETKLQTVTASLSAAVTSSQVARVIVEETLTAFDADSCDLYVSNGRELRLAGHSGRALPPPSEGPPFAVTEAARTRKLVVCEPEDATVSAPLVLGERVLGAIGVTFAAARAFDGSDRRLLESIGRQCAEALDRAALYERERDARRIAQRATERLVRLQAMTAALATAVTGPDVAEIVVTQGAVALGADAAAVHLLTDDGRELTLSAQSGYPDDLAGRSSRLSVGEALGAGDAIRRRKILWFESTPALESRFPREASFPTPWEAVAFIPLVGREGSLGLLTLRFGESRRERREDLALLATLGRQCGQALERAQLYEQEREARDWEARLQEFTAAVSGATDVSEVSETVLDQALGSLGATAGVLALRDGDGVLRRLAARGSGEVAELSEPMAFRSRFPLEDATRRNGVVIRRDGSGCVVGAPLRLGPRSIGALGVALGDRTRLSAAERTFLDALTRQAAQAIERALLYEDEQAARQAAERANERLRKLEAVAQVSLAARTLDELLEDLLPLVRDLFGADRAALLLLDDEREELWMRAAVGLGEDDRAQVQVAVGRGIAGRIAASGSGLLVNDVLAAGPESAYLREHGGSLIGVPLKVEGRVLGVLHASSDRLAAFDDRDLRILTVAGERIALVLERISLYEREHVTAVTLQRSVLPEQMPEVDRVKLAARYVPGSSGVEVGGDWYDAIELGRGRIGIVVGDVVGKGVLAAATMAQLRNALRVYALEGLKPASVLAKLNRLGETTSPSFATLLYAVVDTESLVCRYASAGHPPPLLVRADGPTEFLEGGRSLPLGVHAEARYRHDVVELAPGDTLVLYTDGLVERRGSTLDEGLEQLKVCVQSGPAELETLLDHVVDSLLADAASSDDVAVLALRAAPEYSRRLSRIFPAKPSALAEMRGRLRDWLSECGVPDSIGGEIVLACSEACANAVEHAQEPAKLEFEITAEWMADEVVVRVRDFGQWREPRDESDRGFGFRLIDEMMDQVAVRPNRDGTEVELRRRVGEGLPAR
jgi:PAS domain S-box-containing protein